ncbi:MAG: hypothetical protein GY812_17360 [Actinomycetia bacterium]|nr:hypothetical protein [Actinomycetes bacterium]
MAAIIEIPTHDTPARGTGSRPRRLQSAPRRAGRSSIRHQIQPRAVLAAAILTLLAGVGIQAIGGVDATTELPVASGEHHVVGPGDTLWSIASQWAPAMPAQEAIERVSALNGGITDVDLGDVVALPLLQS